jgi:hypothetical protein
MPSRINKEHELLDKSFLFNFFLDSFLTVNDKVHRDFDSIAMNCYRKWLVDLGKFPTDIKVDKAPCIVFWSFGCPAELLGA